MSVYPNVDEVSLARLVPYFCMSSYLYYQKDKQVLSDGDYDKLCKRLLENWGKVKHPHKWLIKKADLAAGTGYAMRWYAVPTMTISAAELWYEQWQEECK